MSAFTLEIVRKGETPAVADVVTLPDGRLIWRQVEALALLIESPDGAFIRVKNENAETIIRAGVRTTLASIHHCSCTGCPLKKALAKRATAEISPGGDALTFDKTTLYPCEAGAGEAYGS
ncbi:MAG: hypothetical protein WAK01_20250 [Methylocystis sp.]